MNPYFSVNRVVCTGDFIFSSSVDRTVRCWDFDRGTCIREFTGHQNGVFPILFVPAEDEDDDVAPSEVLLAADVAVEIAEELHEDHVAESGEALSATGYQLFLPMVEQSAPTVK